MDIKSRSADWLFANLLSIAWMLLPAPGFSQQALEKTLLLDGKVEILIPPELSSMRNEMWALKYPGMPRPVLALTDDNAEVNFIGDMTKQAATEDQLVSFKDFQIDRFRKSRSDLKILDNGVKTFNGRKVGYFKFLSRASGQKIFNYYFFTIVDGKVLLFTFNCIKELQKTWEKTADEMLASLRVIAYFRVGPESLSLFRFSSLINSPTFLPTLRLTAAVG